MEGTEVEVELEIRQGERVEGILKPVRKVLTEVTEEQHDYRSCLLRRLFLMSL